MTNAQFEQLLSLLTKGQNVKAKPAKRSVKKVKKTKAVRVSLEESDAQVIAAFNAKGIKTADIALRSNVFGFNDWKAKGRIVSKGQHGVRGLFHVSQTEELKVPVAA